VTTARRECKRKWFMACRGPVRGGEGSGRQNHILSLQCKSDVVKDVVKEALGDACDAVLMTTGLSAASKRTW